MQTTKRRRTPDEIAEIQRESLGRAASGVSMTNYLPIIAEFTARGIPADDIKPRENVFTFHAWRALGRTVRKGEKGVACCVWIPCRKKEADGTETEGTRPTTAYVFHVSQTEIYLPKKG